jgi:ABC-type lipoprotein export system ATPase subunit
MPGFSRTVATNMQDNAPIYDVDGLSFSYMLGHQKVQALRNVSLQVQRGDFVCLSGPSGSGKTTLLSVLGLIEPVQEGKVLFEGRSLAEMTEKDRNHARRFRIGFVFPVLTAEENVEFFLTRQGVPKAERRKRVDEALEAVHITSQRKQKPLEMSGGQRQRVALARAIAKRPDVIIADEPTASLDQATGKEIMQIFVEQTKERGVSVIAASHDPMVLAFAARKIDLRDGEVASC